MIRTKRFSFRDAHKREIERMSFRQIERLRIAPKRDRDLFYFPPKLSFRRLSFLPLNVFKIYLSHTRFVSQIPFLRQLLFQFFDRSEEVALFFNTGEDLVGNES